MLTKNLVYNFRSSCKTVFYRSLSTPPKKEITKEELEAGLKKVEKHRKFVSSTSKPKSFSQVACGVVESDPAPHELAALSGMPSVHQKRTVIIQSRPQSAQSHGDRTANQWQITWKKAGVWVNKLTGYISTADPMHSVKLTFDSKEEAVAYAEKNGWDYETKKQWDTETTEIGWRDYSHNFLPERVILQVQKEGGIKSQYFQNSRYGESHFFMPLKYHGDGEVTQHG